MRRGLVLLLLVLPVVLAPASASEARRCDLAPVPERAADGSDFALGPLPRAELHFTGIAANETHARVDESRYVAAGATIVEAVLVAESPTYRVTVWYQYILTGTRDTTCFSWPVGSQIVSKETYAWTEFHVWANATAAGDLLLEGWTGP